MLFLRTSIKALLLWLCMVPLAVAQEASEAYGPPVAAPAVLQGEWGVAAVVNDDIITTQDVTERLRLTMLLAGLPNTQQVREGLQVQVVRSLIDEQLQAQEAERLSILIPPKEVDDGIARMNAARPPDVPDVLSLIARQNISQEAFREQVESQLIWAEILRRKISRDVVVSQEEVTLAQQKMQQGKSETEVKISVMTLPVRAPEDEEEIRELASLLVQQLREGKSFESVAAQIEGDPATTSQRGRWVQPSQLNDALARAVLLLGVGEVSPPLRTFDGYQILHLEDKRTQNVRPSNAEIALKEIVLSLEEGAERKEVDVLLEIAKEIRQRPGSCMEQGIAGVEDFAELNIEVNYVRTFVPALAPQIAQMVSRLKVTEVSEPFATPEGIRLLMLCERIDRPLPLPDAEWVREQLRREKLALEAAKFMRNLRREAFLDVRL